MAVNQVGVLLKKAFQLSEWSRDTAHPITVE